MARKVHHGDARDHCYNCLHTVEYCDNERKQCKYNEATQDQPNARTKLDLDARRGYCGVKEVPLFKLGDGMSEFCDAVAAYTEPWMRSDTWELA
jgi:hypothetical protein